MAFNTKDILRDLKTIPIPQFFNPTADDFNPLTGADLGAGRYGSDHIVWGQTAGGLYVPVLVGTDGKPQVEQAGRFVKEETLFDGTTKGIAQDDTATINGLVVDRIVLELQLADTVTPSVTVTFCVKGPVGSNASVVQGFDVSDATQLVSQITLTATTPKIYIFEGVAGLDFILTLTAISGANAALTAKARQVA